jgi:hypothetical protein
LTGIFIYALPGLYKWPFLKVAAAFKVIKTSFSLFNIILFLMASNGLGTALLWRRYWVVQSWHAEGLACRGKILGSGVLY